MTATAPSRCLVCEESNFRFLFEKNDYSVQECLSCKTARVETIPSPEALRKHYDLSYFKGSKEKFGYVDYATEEEGLVPTFKSRKTRIESEISKGRILDVGCATGGFLKVFGPHWEKHGIELSSELLEAHPAPKDISIWIGDFLEYETADLFDVITLWDVLDHARDPAAMLEKAAKLLRPGGLLCVLVGDRTSLFARVLGKRWHLYIPPTHLTFFSREGLSRLLDKTGFEFLSRTYEGKWVPLSQCFFRLSYILPFKFIWKLYEWLADTRLGRLWIPINLRDVALVYSRKR